MICLGIGRKNLAGSWEVLFQLYTSMKHEGNLQRNLALLCNLLEGLLGTRIGG